MSEDVQPEMVKSSPVRRRLVIYAVVLVVVFLLGFIPMGLKARECARGLGEAEHQLILVRMQSNLASAVIDARRGDYEPARQAASQFFNSLYEQTNGTDASAFTQAQRKELQPLLTGRDDIITLLARSDPASADRLSDLFVSYRKSMNG